MRGRTVLILLVLVVGLVAFIELYEHKLPSSEERAVLEKLVFEANEDEILALELNWSEGFVRLERSAGGEWRLVEPISARADGDLVASVVESLVTLEKKRTLEGTSHEETGLDPPRLTAALITANGRSELLVGSEVPAGNSMIASRTADGEIFVVDDAVWPELRRQPGEWRSRQVLGVGEERVQSLAIETSAQRLALSRKGSDFWLEAPAVDRADPEKVGDLLTALASMRVVSFVDDLPGSLGDLGLDPPVASLEITTGDSAEPQHLAWGGPVAGEETLHYARVEDQVVATEGDLMQYLDVPAAEWQSLELTSLETFQIDTMQVLQKDLDALTLMRQGANWKSGEDEISFTSVSDLLYAIAGARAESVLPVQKADFLGLESAGPSLELILQGQQLEQSVSLYLSGEAGARAVVSERDVVLLVGHDEFTEILAKVAAVRAAASIKTAADEQLQNGTSELNSDQQR